MISRFRGEHFYLSNMSPLRVWIPTTLGILVPTSEHKYMADRLVDPELHERVALARGDENDKRIYKDGVAAKRLAHEFMDSGAERLDILPSNRIAIMYAANLGKFVANHEIAFKLVATGDEEIVEGNTWEDRFWGVDPPGSDNGQNHLGHVIMRVREVLRHS